MKNRRHVPRRQRGFTLAEILVTTAIFVIVMIAALTVYDRSNKVFKNSTEAADLQQSTRIGFDKLVSDLRMTGFDFSRGGTPTTTGQFAQPDEQIEYAGPTAIAIRANFNYVSAASQGNGLEPAYTPYDANKSPIFPYVTTSNDEIVIYALKSADTTKNTSTINFYADTGIPRHAYLGSSTNGKEDLVTVTGIDTTNANPPYTLYRMTVAEVLASKPGTPVAENIRSLHFFYYTDAKGTTLLQDTSVTPSKDITVGHDAGGTTFPTTYTVTLPNGSSSTFNTGAIGGDGLFDAANSATANVADRGLRSIIQSVKVDLTGINANPDMTYVNPTETIGAIKSYRQYQLSALIVPRNLGLTGFAEPSYIPPAPPTISGMCVSACAAPVICWTAPTTGGPVLQYTIEWDTVTAGPFANSFVVTDMTINSIVLKDDGVMDPSRTWYYRMTAQNNNGSSAPSDLFSVSPKNMTRPMPPSGVTAMVATAPASSVPANIDYSIPISWNSPSQNDPAKSLTACSGAGCAADGRNIPSQEFIHYKVARGLTSSFDPSAGEGVTVLDIATKSQPIGVAPGSPMTWIDSPTNSVYPPGTCVPYYYRVQAQDRCAANPNYNSSGLTTDSVSDWSPAAPAAGQGGQAYDAGSTVLASAPPTISVDTAKSLCPATGLCTIYLKWGQVTTDNAGHAIGVDRYRIKRSKKIITDVDYTLDTSFGTGGYYSQSGASQTNNGTVTFTDTTAAAADANSQPLYYKYTVTANDCRLGIESAPAYYPSLCTINPVIVEANASNPAASGDSPAQAWVFNYGDTITVSPPVSGGVTIKNVKFTTYLYPNLTLVDDFPLISTAPYTMAWTDHTDLSIYYVKIVVTSSTGCVETHVKYVQDQQAAGCSFVSQTAPAPSNSTSGSTTTDTESLTIKNGGTDTMTLNSQSYSLTFKDPDGKHSDITLTSVVFASSNTFTDTLATAATPGTVTRSFPTSTPVLTVAPNASLTVTVRFQFKKTDGANTVSPLTKLCLGYTIPTEPGVVKKCNAVGQAATSANPTSCD
jgi:prepilin-type N-terminal cleavage/methylation domain-containing protein